MKYLYILIFLLLLSSCGVGGGSKVKYWCGDHACKNKKERQIYFEKTLVVEYRKNEKNKVNQEKDYMKIANEDKVKKNFLKKKFKIKKGKKAKYVKLSKDKIKKDKVKSVKKNNKIKNSITSNEKTQKITKIAQVKNLKFENIAKNLLKKTENLKYPDINNLPY